MMLLLVACGKGSTEATDVIKVGMATDSGTIDDKSFNQGSWEGVLKFQEAHDNVEVQYIKPTGETLQDYTSAIDNLILSGNEVISGERTFNSNIGQTYYPSMVSFYPSIFSPRSFSSLSSYQGNVAESFKNMLNKEELKNSISGDIYQKQFSKYVLLKLEYLMSDNTVHLSSFNCISVEHVLPQNPKNDSEWNKIFTKDERAKWTNKLGNLVLISKRKNSSLGNCDFKEKKEKYLKL